MQGIKRWNSQDQIITDLSMDDRLAMCNMAIEAGAKNGIIEPDDCTEKYMNDRAQREYKFSTQVMLIVNILIFMSTILAHFPLRLPYLIYLRIHVPVEEAF